MRHSILGVALGIMALAVCSRGSCQDADLTGAFKRVTNATVTVFPRFAQPEDKTAPTPILPMTSGFFVSPDILACSLHAIRGAVSLNVMCHGSLTQRLTVRGLLACDTANDLALLGVDGDHEFIELGKIAVDAEVPVYTHIGPRGFVNCTAVRHTSKWDLPAAQAADTNQWPGLDVLMLTGPTIGDNNSFGMPVVDKAGRVVGVYAYLEYIGRGVDWMLPIEPLTKLLASSKVAAIAPLSALRTLDLSKAERLGLIRQPDINVTLDSGAQYIALRGIKGVSIIVDGLSDDIEKDGLRKDSIATDIELKLREAGIEVLNEPKSGVPWLYVNVLSLSDSVDGVYYYYSRCELDDDVRMDNRNKNVAIVSAPIWQAPGVIGTVGRSRVSKIRDTIKDQVDKFIVDLLKANPKP